MVVEIGMETGRLGIFYIKREPQLSHGSDWLRQSGISIASPPSVPLLSFSPGL